MTLLDFGRRRVGNVVIDARRNLSGVCGRWYPVLLDLHRFFIAISRAAANHDGSERRRSRSSWYGLLVLISKRRRLVHAVQDRAFFAWATRHVGDSHWVHVPAPAICAEDVALWPYTPRLLEKWVSFLGSIQWPVGGLDLVVGGISYVELLTLYELWAGERLSLEKAHPRYLRPGRPISVSVVPFGPGIDIWRSCRFIGALMRSLCLLLGGLRRFVPCSMVLMTAGFVMLGGRRVVMVLLPDLVRVPLSFSWMSFWVSLVILLGLPVRCLLVLFPQLLRC